MIAKGKTDVAPILTNKESFYVSTKYLIKDELALHLEPIPLTLFQQEWNQIHNRLGNISVAVMDIFSTMWSAPT